MKFAPIVDPAARRPSPKPVRVDLRRVFVIGTMLWIIATILCLFLQMFGLISCRITVVCAIGVVIGLMMLVWEHFDRWDYRRLGE